MIKGSSPDIMAENIRQLRQGGMSEEAATKKARDFAKGSESSAVMHYTAPTGKRSFAVVTKDYSGLGWAKKLDEEGESVVLVTENPEEEQEDREMFDQIATGWLPKMDLKDALKKLPDSTYWIFTENNYPEEADALRKKGRKVFGTGEFHDQMEHDRDYAVNAAAEAGLKAPETHEFKTRDEGLKFLDEHWDTAYVLKPDEGQNYQTFVPALSDDAEANRETRTYLEHLKDEPGTYVLQERISGTELNVEVWMYEGKPFFAFATLEAKRKNPNDLGEMAGCAGDLTWVVPVDSKIVKDTVGKMLSHFEDEDYTGFADVNVILTDKGPRYLESCCRHGYNAHPNLFLALAKRGYGDIMADFMDGKTDKIAKDFSKDFGSSLTIFIDHPREGLPVHLDQAYEEQWFPFDGYKEDDVLLLSGYSHEVGIFVEKGKTPEEAMENVLIRLRDQEAVSFPDRYFRTDLAKTGYPNSILSRYYDLQKMGYVES